MIRVKEATRPFAFITLGRLRTAPAIDTDYDRLGYQAFKRAFDFIGALVALVLLSPVLLAVALAVRLLDGGPILFRQTRIGRHGRPFRILKFRTMVPNAEAILQSRPDLLEEYRRTYKIENDPRISRLGRFLRESSLDELPQLWNVVKGEMSLVGPRPIVPKELEKYGDKADVYLACIPGCAGLWQCSGRSDLSYPERVDLDVQYHETASAATDLRILARTVRCVLGRVGAR